MLTRVGRRLVVGLPAGIGKPNLLANAFVRRAASDPSIRLTIVTALSLKTPRWSTDLERRYVAPLVRRVFGDYPELEYVRMLEERRLPANIEVIEFYLEPGAWLGNDAMQQHYLSSNYTHVLRDAIGRGLNVLLQLVAPPPPLEAVAGMVSLGSNADLTVDLLPQLDVLRASGRPFVLVGQHHRELPFMYGDALVPESCFDYLVDEPASSFPLFAPPNLPIGLTEHAIALNVSALVRDGGTLQLGIGELGDAITSAILLRHRENPLYREALAAGGILERNPALIAQEGGTEPFERGLYACSEMLADGFVDLYRAGVLKRCVFPNARLQRLLDDGAISESVRPRCSRGSLPGGWTDSRRRSSPSCAQPVSFAMTCVSSRASSPRRMARAPRPASARRTNGTRLPRCSATGCGASSPMPGSSSAREASIRSCARCRSRSGGGLRCAASPGSTIWAGPARS